MGDWTKVDDRDASVTYDGTWENVSQPEAYNGTTTWSGDVSGTKTFTYSFTGTGIRFYSFDCDGGDVDLYINDEYQTTVETTGSCNASVLKYENTSLSSGPHTLSGTVSSGEVEVDAFEYDTGSADTDPPTPDPMTFSSPPSTDGESSISMTAAEASDISGVEYYFEETSGNLGGDDSGWQDNTTYTDTGLTPDTEYCYKVKARDKSVNQNKTTYSASECAATQSDGLNIYIDNPSFESGTTGWTNASLDNSEYYAAPDGENYAKSPDGSSYTYQETDHTIASGESYTLTVWARCLPYTESELDLLKGAVEDYPAQNSAVATAEVRLYYGSTEIASTTVDVNPKALIGAPETMTNDDGGNVWVDTEMGYRHAFSENHFYQPISSDPILDEWFAGTDNYQDGQCSSGAKGPVILPNGNKWIYGSNSCNDYCCGSGETCKATLYFEPVSGGDPDYVWSNCEDQTYIFWHEGDEDPWLADGQVFYDNDTGELWMVVGGGTALLVVELDPTTGYVKGYSSCIEYDTHTGEFTQVADWNGDEWTYDSEWFEGAALYKHNGYWYCLTSNGDLSANYTIRMGRGTSPTGPFYDKDGVDMNTYDSGENEYGNSFLFGDDGEQVVPGHPHIWEESGTFYLGYDYRLAKEGQQGDTTFDYLGIRRLYWVNDWPTIWTPITLTFDADDYPDAIGSKLGISVRNVGQSGSIAGFDSLSLTYSCSEDMDGDGDVDFCDFAHFALQWLQTGCGECSGADFTGDSNVDPNDLYLFTDNWLCGK